MKILQNNFTSIAGRLRVPVETKAILFDLDGVVIDSLELDFRVTNCFFTQKFGSKVTISSEFIQSIFAYAVPDYCRLVLNKISQEYNITPTEADYTELLEKYSTARETEKFILHPGINKIFEGLRSQKIPKILVSNNSMSALENILTNSDLKSEFPQFVGNDLVINGKPVRKKPEPDMFLYAAEQLNLPAKNCVVIEDSILGAEGASKAGCHVIGVGTGSASIADFEKSSFVDQIYTSFA